MNTWNFKPKQELQVHSSFKERKIRYIDNRNLAQADRGQNLDQTELSSTPCMQLFLVQRCEKVKSALSFADKSISSDNGDKLYKAVV